MAALAPMAWPSAARRVRRGGGAPELRDRGSECFFMAFLSCWLHALGRMALRPELVSHCCAAKVTAYAGEIGERRRLTASSVRITASVCTGIVPLVPEASLVRVARPTMRHRRPQDTVRFTGLKLAATCLVDLSFLTGWHGEGSRRALDARRRRRRRFGTRRRAWREGSPRGSWRCGG